MSTQFILKPIEAKSKGEVKRLRSAGFVPVSVQHRGSLTRHYQQAAAPLNDFIQRYGKATLIDLWLEEENKAQRVMIHEVQRDPMSRKLLQVTFQEMRKDDTLKTSVPLVFKDSPEGASANKEAIVQHLRDTIEIECEQSNLPDSIVVSLAALQVGEMFRVSDIVADSHYKILTPANTVLASFANIKGGAEPEAVAATAEAV